MNRSPKMKLFLASANNTLPLLASKLPKGNKAKVVFVANAADNHSGEKWWVEADRDAFRKLGCDLAETDLRTITADELAKTIENAEIIHFAGGSVLYLISLIKKRELVETITGPVRTGKIIYSGTSAGSMIASSDLRLLAYDDEDAEYAKGMKDFSGLSLAPFLIVPHANNKDFAKSNVRIVEHLADNLQTLIFLHDEQAVLVEDGKFEIIERRS